MIKYERPTEGDADELAELWLELGREKGTVTNPNVEWWKERFNLLLGSDNYLVYKATDKGKAVGFVDGFVMKEPATGKIHGIGQYLYVKPEYRDTRVAGNIYKRLFKQAKEMGATVFDIFQHCEDDRWTDKHFEPVYTVVRREHVA